MNYRTVLRSESLFNMTSNVAETLGRQVLGLHEAATGTADPELDQAGALTFKVMGINTTPTTHRAHRRIFGRSAAAKSVPLDTKSAVLLDDYTEGSDIPASA